MHRIAHSKDWIKVKNRSYRAFERKVPKHIAIDVLALIDRLSPGDGLCHCDLSPGNVIMTAEGPKLIDWAYAMRAPAAVDLGFLHVILSELAPEIADNPERPRATNAAAQSEYARLAGTSLAESVWANTGNEQPA